MDALTGRLGVNRRAPKEAAGHRIGGEEECACNNVDASLLYVLSKKEIGRHDRPSRRSAAPRAQRAHAQSRTAHAQGAGPQALLNARSAPVEGDGASSCGRRCVHGHDLGDSRDLVVEGLVERTCGRGGGRGGGSSLPASTTSTGSPRRCSTTTRARRRSDGRRRAERRGPWWTRASHIAEHGGAEANPDLGGRALKRGPAVVVVLGDVDPRGPPHRGPAPGRRPRRRRGNPCAGAAAEGMCGGRRRRVRARPRAHRLRGRVRG